MKRLLVTCLVWFSLMFGVAVDVGADAPKLSGKRWLNTDTAPILSKKIVVIHYMAVGDDNASQMQAVYEKYKEFGILIVGSVAADERACIPFIQKEGLTYPVLTSLELNEINLIINSGGFPCFAVYDEKGDNQYDGRDLTELQKTLDKLLADQHNKKAKGMAAAIAKTDKLFTDGEYEKAGLIYRGYIKDLRFSDVCADLEEKLEICGEKALESFDGLVASSSPTSAGNLADKAQHFADRYAGTSAEEGFRSYADRLEWIAGKNLTQAFRALQAGLAAKLVDRGDVRDAYKAYEQFAKDSDRTMQVEARPGMRMIEAVVKKQVNEYKQQFGTMMEDEARKKIEALAVEWRGTGMVMLIKQWRDGATAQESTSNKINTQSVSPALAAVKPALLELEADSWESGDPEAFLVDARRSRQEAESYLSARKEEADFKAQIERGTRLLFQALRKYEKAVANSDDKCELAVLEEIAACRTLAAQALANLD